MSQTILVADDSQTIRKVVKMALKVAPFEVASVGSGQQALQKAQQGGLGLVILDYHLPDVSGYEVADQLKQQAATSEVPIVMLAGEQHGFDEAQARESGVDRIIPKPFDTDTLLDAIVATTSISKKALVKRQKGAPKTQTPLSGMGSGGPSAEKPPTPGGPAGMDKGRASGGSSGGRRRQSGGSNSGGSNSGDQPRMRTPGSQSGSSSGSSPRRAGSGAEQPQSGARRPSGGGQPADRGARRPSGSGAAQSPGSGERRPSGGGPPSTPPDAADKAENEEEQEAVELDIDLDEESEPEPSQQAQNDSQSKPRFQSPSGNQGDESASGARRRPVTTPESQAGSPAGGGQPSGNAPADSRTDTPESQPSPLEESGGAPPQADGSGVPSGGGGLAGAGIDEQQLEQMVEAHVKETVREKLPKILRKLMGEVFQERVLPKLLEHGEQQVESLVGDQLDKRIHDEVQRQLDQLLEEL